MGKAQSKLPQAAMKRALKYFEAHEINDVLEIFQNLRVQEQKHSDGSGTKTHAGIDIATFGEYWPSS